MIPQKYLENVGGFFYMEVLIRTIDLIIIMHLVLVTCVLY